MLARVADRICWMSRQMERAENMARILGVTSNLVLLDTGELQEQNLLAPLSITETEAAYRERHDKLTLPALIEFMALDEKNPSSIYSCLKWARENGHAVRWLITSEMWETLNATWLEVRAIPRNRVTGAGATEFFDWVKERSHLFRGQKDEPAKRLAYELHARLSYADVEEVFQGGLHEFLTAVLEEIGELGSRIQRAYLGAV